MKEYTVGYIKKDDKYLFLHRTKKQNDINHGKYIGVGGKLELNETPSQCIDREVYEETGLIVKERQFLGIVYYRQNDGYAEKMNVFLITDFYGEQKVCDEGDLYWLSPEEFFQKPHWKSDEEFIQYVFKSQAFGTYDYLVDAKTEAIISSKHY